MNTRVRAGRQFGRNPPLRETYAVISRRCHLVLMRERKRFHGISAVLHGHIPEGRREQEVAQVRATGAGQVRMGEAQDGIVAVMVAGTAVPARVPGVGTQLDHARRHGRSGIGMSMETRADEGIHGLHGRFLSGTRNDRQQGGSNGKERDTHRVYVLVSIYKVSNPTQKTQALKKLVSSSRATCTLERPA